MSAHHQVDPGQKQKNKQGKNLSVENGRETKCVENSAVVGNSCTASNSKSSRKTIETLKRIQIKVTMDIFVWGGQQPLRYMNFGSQCNWYRNWP